jgi:hypothetical protein
MIEASVMCGWIGSGTIDDPYRGVVADYDVVYTDSGDSPLPAMPDVFHITCENSVFYNQVNLDSDIETIWAVEL